MCEHRYADRRRCQAFLVKVLGRGGHGWPAHRVALP